MPELSRFFCIVIKMFFDDHQPPHFHAYYGDHEVQVDIRSLGVLNGRFPPRAFSLVIEWASIHREELLENWERASSMRPLQAVAPLE